MLRNTVPFATIIVVMLSGTAAAQIAPIPAPGVRPSPELRHIDLSIAAGQLMSSDWTGQVLLGSSSGATGAFEQLLLRDLGLVPGRTVDASVTYWRGRYGFRVHAARARSCVAAGRHCTVEGSFQSTDPLLGPNSIRINAWLYEANGMVGLREYVFPRADQQRPARVPDIYFAPTPHTVADAMLRLARVTADDVVYDLGSGDGRIPIIAAQKYGARAVGIEIDGRLVQISRQVAQEGNVADRVRFIEGDLFTADISPATIVTLYLSPSINTDLEWKLKRELKPGTRIVSHQFRIGNWTPDEIRAADDGTDLFLWRVSTP